MTTLNISLSEPAVSRRIWVNIEQEEAEESSTSFSDIITMGSYAQSGVTATLHNTSCGIDISEDSIAIPLTVFVWPSLLDLNYNIKGVESGIVVSNKTRVDIVKEHSITVTSSAIFAFDYLIENLEFEWETPCYNSYGEEVEEPTYTVVDNKIVFDASIFGVARVKYTAVGYSHTVTLIYENTPESINNLKDQMIGESIGASVESGVSMTISSVTVIVSYVENGILQEIPFGLEIPESIEKCLPQCRDGSLVGSSILISPDTEYWTDVYYNDCDGSILDINERTV